MRAVEAVPMGRLQRRIFDRLARRVGAWVRNEDLVDACYWDDPDGGPLDARAVVAVQVFHLKAKMRRANVAMAIESHIGRAAERRLVLVQQ